VVAALVILAAFFWLLQPAFLSAQIGRAARPRSAAV
jgi:hypothetical protein